MEPATAVLVVGAPRSGTTWIAKALAHSTGAIYVHEPDNHGHTAAAVRAKAGLGCFPSLEPGDAPRRYERLWQAAFSGAQPAQGRRARLASRLLWSESVTRRDAAVTPDAPTPWAIGLAGALAPRPCRRAGPVVPVVKSVQAQLALSWLRERFDPRVVVVQREPLNVLASWLDQGFGELGAIPRMALERYTRRWNVGLPAANADLFDRIAWRVGFLCAVLDEQARQGTSSYVIHDEICADPVTRLRALAAEVGLQWNDAAEAFVRESQAPGEGYDTHRISAQQPGRWRERLSADQVRRARVVFECFPLTVPAGTYPGEL